MGLFFEFFAQILSKLFSRCRRAIGNLASHIPSRAALNFLQLGPSGGLTILVSPSGLHTSACQRSEYWLPFLRFDKGCLSTAGSLSVNAETPMASNLPVHIMSFRQRQNYLQLEPLGYHVCKFETLMCSAKAKINELLEVSV